MIGWLAHLYTASGAVFAFLAARAVIDFDYPAAFFWLGAIRLVFALHGQCFVNSVSHLRPGTREGEDSSRNVPWLALWHGLQGENTAVSWCREECRHGGRRRGPSSMTIERARSRSL